ncbi:MAG TPA: hypothetical protein VIX81_04065 [Gammaproteobacteria bacterium]
MQSRSPGPLITGTTPAEYFQQRIGSVMEQRSVDADADTVYYLVNLLTHFVRAENLFQETPEGLELRPLAFLYADALHGTTRADRNDALRRLGDVALFIAGFFADSLDRKAVDVDYYIAMGGGAYGSLSQNLRGTLRGQALSPMFRELAEKFDRFVDVLGEISEEAQMSDTRNLLRTYEVWLRTGSPRLAERLRALGVEPNRTLTLRPH